MGYMGSEEFIRLQFEEYLLALLSTTKYHIYLTTHPPLPGIEGDPSNDFNPEFLTNWQQTSSFNLFTTHTDAHLFDIVEPRHPTAGNLSFEDIQRRLAQQIQTLHLDDRLATSRETLNKHLATGQEKVSTAFSKLRADIEAMREAQRKRAQQQTSTNAQTSSKDDPSTLSIGTERSTASSPPPTARRGPDIATAQASMQAAGQKAGAYISSWGAWASERRKGWSESRSVSSSENVGGSAGGVGEKSGAGAGAGGPGRLSRWSSSASLGGRFTKGKEENGGDGIGRLDA